MISVWLVVRSGVYDQGVFGVYGSQEMAARAVERAKTYEYDEYHGFDIREYEVNCDARGFNGLGGYVPSGQAYAEVSAEAFDPNAKESA